MPIKDDNGGARLMRSPLADPHGQAALLLVESLIHILMERGALTISDAVEVVSTAMDVQLEVAEAADGAGERMWQSYSLLSSIATSLRRDSGGSDGAETQIFSG